VGRAAQRRQRAAGRACSGMECLWAAASAEPIAALNPRLLLRLIEIPGICLSAPPSAFDSQFEARASAQSRTSSQCNRPKLSRARKRGWITTSTSAAELSVSANTTSPREIRFRWRTDEDDLRDAEAVAAERLRDEGSTWSVLDGPLQRVARPSNTRLTQSLQTRTKILATA
jgi:hypothetical protein